jgi:hypothetical protein
MPKRGLIQRKLINHLHNPFHAKEQCSEYICYI